MLPVGTTDHPCGVTDNPTPSEAEIQFILKEIRNYLSPDVNGGCTCEKKSEFYASVCFLLYCTFSKSTL